MRFKVRRQGSCAACSISITLPIWPPAGQKGYGGRASVSVYIRRCFRSARLRGEQFTIHNLQFTEDGRCASLCKFLIANCKLQASLVPRALVSSRNQRRVDPLKALTNRGVR